MKLIFLLLLVLNCSVNAQVFIDTVYSVNFCQGQNLGRSPEFFPKNIFGAPSTNSTKFVPTSSEEELCSLGPGGEIVVGAKDYVVVDKPGVDFIVFENVFANFAETKFFVEPAIISVSKDGVNFTDFPFNSETLAGFAGINWTNGDKNPFDIAVSGGDGFDLSILGIDSIKYIKIKDTAIIASHLDFKHPYYSPAAVLTGFDLDAVALVNVAAKNGHINNFVDTNFVSITDIGDKIICSANIQCNILLTDILGNTLLNFENENFVVLDKNNLSIGIYFLIVTESNGRTYLQSIRKY